MSTQVTLSIRAALDLEAVEKNVELPLIQLKTRVKFWNGSSWTRSFEGVVDTGCPVSLIPESIWEDIKHTSVSPHAFGISGISPKGTPPISSTLAKISCLLHDGSSRSPTLDVRCSLLRTNDVPLVIGILDILTLSKLVFDYKNNTAFLEF